METNTARTTAALCLTLVLFLACGANRPPGTAEVRLIPNAGPPGTVIRVRIIASDPDGDALTVWAIVQGDSFLPAVRVECPAVPDSAEVFAGIWVCDTAGFHGSRYLGFDAHASDSRTTVHGLSSSFRLD